MSFSLKRQQYRKIRPGEDLDAFFTEMNKVRDHNMTVISNRGKVLTILMWILLVFCAIAPLVVHHGH